MKIPQKKLDRVAFINPRGAERNNQNLIMQDIFPEISDDIILIGDDTEFVPHLGLLTIAALLPPDANPVYVDEEYIMPAEVPEKVFRDDFDLVCLSAYNPQAFRAYEIARWYRERNTPVIMGGLHVTGIPEEAVKFVDSVFVGEAENTFRQFLRDFEEGKTGKIYKAENPVNLEDSPLPRFDIVDNLAMYNKIPLIATRGCPHTCDFCIFPTAYHTKFRHKPISTVIREIETVKKLHPAPFISFSDENMLADREFSKELAKEITRLNISWECYCDIGIASDDELLKLLAKSKCQLLQIGLETIDPENLKDVDPWKYRQVKGYPEAIRRIQKAGIPVMGMFIAGFDGDDPGVFNRLRKFIMNNRIREIDFAVLTPMPGTPLFTRLKKEGRILTENWNHYPWTHVNFQPMRMTAGELQEGPLKLFRYFTDAIEKMKPGKGEFLPEPAFHIRSQKMGSDAGDRYRR